jgi:DNA-binding MarR family transcriptional regulator
LFELIELLTQVNAQILRALSPLVKSSDISVTELIILWKINKNGPCKITDLSLKTGVPASTLTSLFDRLETKDFLTRAHDKKDRRCILIQGTPKLKDMIVSLVEKADGELTTLLDTLPPEFLKHFLEDLQTLQKHLIKETDN